MTSVEAIKSPANRDEITARRLTDLKIGESLLMALIAQGAGGNRELHDYCETTLQLGTDDITVAARSLNSAGRAYPSFKGLQPTPGAFPLTPYEHRLQTELVAPAAAEFEKLQQLKEAQGAVLRDAVS